MRAPARHVAKDGSASWKVRFRHDGRQTSETFDDPASAAEFCRLMTVMAPYDALKHMARRTQTVSALPALDDWAEQHVVHLTGVTDGTRHGYRGLYARTWGPLLGELPIDLIDRQAVARAVNDLSSRYADKTVANAHGLLAAMMRRAVEDGLIAASPCRGIRLPRGSERIEHRYLTQPELAQLLDTIRPHYRPLVLTLAGTGIRWGEAVPLTVADIDLDAATLRVSKAAKWDSSKSVRPIAGPKTSRSRRTVTLPAAVVDELRPLTDRGRSELLFVTPQGHMLRHGNLHRVWTTACRDAGFDPAPRIHDLRHSHVAWLIAAGTPLPVIQARLGHESIQTTIDVYGHLLPDLQHAAAAAADAVLGVRALPPT